MDNYFLISWKHKSRLASAFVLNEAKLDHELISDLEESTIMPFDFELRKVIEVKDELIIGNDLSELNELWLDYQPNSLAWPLMSDKLKFVIENNMTGNEEIDWISCKVKSNKEHRIYYILRFNRLLDVLDMKKTMFVQGTDHIIKPCFSLSKIKSFSIFSKPSAHNLWKITSGLYINEKLKKAIQKEKLSGLDFEKISVV